MWGAVFPGQGSQKVGMGRFLFNEFSYVRETFEEASDTLSINFEKLCFDSDEKTLALTENTQPALLLVSTATFRVLERELGFAPAGAAGHSIGEYAAAVTSQTLQLRDGLRLVRRRGELMQQAVPVGQGAMLAVLGLEESEVNSLCSWARESSPQQGVSGVVEPANFNSPGQIVISGSAQVLNWIRESFQPETLGLQGKKVRLIPLKVSAPFHCSMMKPAETGLAPMLEATTFEDSRWPIAQNVSGRMHSVGSELRENLIKQITGAVRWTDCMSTLGEQGIHHFVECGTGKVLAGLGKKMKEDFQIFGLNNLDDLRSLEKEGLS